MHAGNLECHPAAPEVQEDPPVHLGMVHLLNLNHLHLNNHRKSGLDGALCLGGRKRRRHPPRPLVHPLLRLSSTLGIKSSLGQLGNVSIINALILLNSNNVFSPLSADPQLAPTPPSVEPTLLVPNRGSPGLFGPRTPRSSSYYGN